jgi:asparagine synthase (glutamine-hydrolysing)
MTPRGRALRGRWHGGRLELDPGCATVPAGEGTSLALAGRLCGDARPVAEAAPGSGLRGAWGEFALLAFAPASGRGWLARDALGARDVFYARSGGGLVFADELPALLEWLPATPPPDPDAVTSWLGSGTIPIGQTLYAGIHRLPPGHALGLGGGSGPVAWWTLEPRRPTAPDELEEAVLAETAAAVGRMAGGEASPAVLVSGGLDSSTVLALLSERPDVAPVAYSALFPRHAEVDETELIATLTGELGVPSVRSVVSGGSPLVGALDHLRRWRLPSASANHYLWGPLLARVAADGRTLLLDGEGGDEVFGMQPLALVDALLRGRPRHAQALAGRVYAIGRDGRRRARRLQILARFAAEGAVPYPLQRGARRWTDAGHAAPPMLDRHARARLREVYDPWAWKRGAGPLARRRLLHALTDQRELLDAHGYLRRRAATHGLEARHPFLHDIGLLELAAGIDPEALFDGYRDRPVLRDALRGHLPEALRTRQGKSYFSSLLHDSVMGDIGLLRSLLGAPDAETRAWLDPGWIERELRDPRPDDHPEGRFAWSTQLFRAGSLECWLRSLGDREWPERHVAPLAAPVQQEISAT